jgi:hypothetical protein
MIKQFHPIPFQFFHTEPASEFWHEAKDHGITKVKFYYETSSWWWSVPITVLDIIEPWLIFYFDPSGNLIDDSSAERQKQNNRHANELL